MLVRVNRHLETTDGGQVHVTRPGSQPAKQFGRYYLVSRGKKSAINLSEYAHLLGVETQYALRRRRALERDGEPTSAGTRFDEAVDRAADDKVDERAQTDLPTYVENWLQMQLLFKSITPDEVACIKRLIEDLERGNCSSYGRE